MHATPPSLLERLRQPNQQQAWDLFVQLYTPLLCQWGRQLGLQEAEVADLVQDIFLLLLRKLPEFTYQPHKSFRGWLRTVLVNHWRNLEAARPPAPVDAELDLLAAAPDPLEESTYRALVVNQALQLLRAEFPDKVWLPFWRYAVEGKAPRAVAQELGITENMVYLAKSRVLTRLRQELNGLV